MQAATCSSGRSQAGSRPETRRRRAAAAPPADRPPPSWSSRCCRIGGAARAGQEPDGPGAVAAISSAERLGERDRRQQVLGRGDRRGVRARRDDLDQLRTTVAAALARRSGAGQHARSLAGDAAAAARPSRCLARIAPGAGRGIRPGRPPARCGRSDARAGRQSASAKPITSRAPSRAAPPSRSTAARSRARSMRRRIRADRAPVGHRRPPSVALRRAAPSSRKNQSARPGGGRGR